MTQARVIYFSLSDKQEVAYIFDDRFSGNILLDIKTTRHIGPQVLFIRLLIYLGGVARLGTRTGRPRQNVVLLLIYCVRIQHILL